jgi:hypothetical protein
MRSTLRVSLTLIVRCRRMTIAREFRETGPGPGRRCNHGFMSEMVLSVIAIVLSAVTFGLTYRAGQAVDRRSRIPVLVFVYDEQRGWLLRNVGNGPALNITTAIRKTHAQGEDEWEAPTRVPPIERDGEFELHWLRHANVAVLAATYQDFLAADTSRKPRVYTVTSAYDLNQVVPRRLLPDWSVAKSVPHWHQQQVEMQAGPGGDAGSRGPGVGKR